MAPKRKQPASASSQPTSSRRRKGEFDAPGFVHVVRWQRLTVVEEWDWDKLPHIETCGHSIAEAVDAVKEEIDDIKGLAADTGPVNAHRTIDDAIRGRDPLPPSMHTHHSACRAQI